MIYRKKSVAVVALLLINGCSSSNVEIIFNDTITVNSISNACEIIESIDGVKYENSMSEDLNININGNKIICPDINLSSTGVISLNFTVNGKSLLHNLNIVDDIPPKIESKDLFEVELGNVYFDVLNEIKYSDNYSDVEIGMTGSFDVNKIGTYSINVVAVDTTGNSSTKVITIRVIEKEKEIVEVIVTPKPTKKPSINIGPNDNGASSGNDSSGSSGSGDNTGEDNTEVSKPFLSGVKDIVVSIDSSLSDLTFLLQSGVSSSAAISIDYAEVNMSVPGSYTVRYYTDDNQSATCVVTVQ